MSIRRPACRSTVPRLYYKEKAKSDLSLRYISIYSVYFFFNTDKFNYDFYLFVPLILQFQPLIP
jgi:hypothetical protein